MSEGQQGRAPASPERDMLVEKKRRRAEPGCANNVVMVDTREQKNHVTDYLNKHGISNVRSKLIVGDYTLVNDQSLCIDRKHNLQEVCGNLCQQHERFRAEIMRAKDVGIRLVFLVEHGSGVMMLEDVQAWENPRLKTSPYALSGVGLYRRMLTIQNKYGVEWRFCDKRSTGRIICEMLGVTVCGSTRRSSKAGSSCGRFVSG